MRITCIGFGSRGDVTPLAILAGRFRAAGHAVRLVTHGEFAELASMYDADFEPVPGSYQEFLATPEGRRALGIPGNSPFGCLGLYKPFRECAKDVFDRCWDVSADAEGLICNGLAAAPAALIAARRNIPVVLTLVVPTVPSRDMPHPAMPPWRLGGAYNRLTHAFARRLIDRGAAPVFRIWNAEARRLGGVASADHVRVKVVIPVSRTIMQSAAEWPPSVHVTGFWFGTPTSAEAATTSDLQGFMEQGPPPLFFGFGSMAEDRPAELQTIVQETLERLKMRAVMVGGSGAALAGWSADHVRHVPFVDYSWLFPRVAAVVHQGGVGTAAHALRAGVPQVTIPYCLDHAFWAARLQRAGVAQAGIIRNRLTARGLTNAIRRVLTDPLYRQRAATVATEVKSEQGIHVAEELVNRHFGILRN